MQQADKSWFDRRTTLEKHLMVAVFLAIVLSVLILSGMNCELRKSCSKKNDKKAGNYILQELHPTIKPRDDFYGFVCRKRVNDTLVYADKIPYISNVSIFDDPDVIKKVLSYLETPVAIGEENFSVTAKKFYQACQSAELITDTKVFEKHLDSFRGWPLLLDSWNETDFDWIDLMGKFQDKGYTPGMFVDLDIVPHKDNSSRYIVELKRPPLFGIDWAYLTKPQKHRERYFALMKAVATELYHKYKNKKTSSSRIQKRSVQPGNVHNTQQDLNSEVIKQLDECLQFEIELAQIGYPTKNIYMEVSQLKTKKEWWWLFINKILPSDLELTDDDIVSVAEDYLLEFEKVMKRNRKRVQANHAIWRAMLEKIHLFPTSLYITHYLNVFHGENREPSPECLRRTYQSFPHILHSVYFSEIKEITNTVNYIKDYMLSQVQWMGNYDDKILEKIQISVSSPSDDVLREFYNNLNLTSKGYVDSSFEINRYTRENRYRRLLRNDKANKEILPEFNLLISSNEDNLINLSLALAQKPYFYNDKNMSLNFGALGPTLGTFIMQMFKDIQCKVDFDERWETDLNAKENCTSKISLEKAGTMLAYLAFTEWLEYNNEKNLADYDPRQLFWISAATSWCQLHTLDLLKQIIKDKSELNNFVVTVPFNDSLKFDSSFMSKNKRNE